MPLSMPALDVPLPAMQLEKSHLWPRWHCTSSHTPCKGCLAQLRPNWRCPHGFWSVPSTRRQIHVFKKNKTQTPVSCRQAQVTLHGHTTLPDWTAGPATDQSAITWINKWKWNRIQNAGVILSEGILPMNNKKKKNKKPFQSRVTGQCPNDTEQINTSHHTRNKDEPPSWVLPCLAPKSSNSQHTHQLNTCPNTSQASEDTLTPQSLWVSAPPLPCRPPTNATKQGSRTQANPTAGGNNN